jgi:iron complex outermembrane recepter protein
LPDSGGIRFRPSFRGAQVIGGVDVEFSPGQREERMIRPARVDRMFTDYSEGDLVYDYVNHLGARQTGKHRRPGSSEVRYDHISPKLGTTCGFAPALGLFASYRHGFRAPSEGQFSRQGSSRAGVGLMPVEADK